jgi:hypothetical protein
MLLGSTLQTQTTNQKTRSINTAKVNCWNPTINHLSQMATFLPALGLQWQSHTLLGGHLMTFVVCTAYHTPAYMTVSGLLWRQSTI